MHRTLQDAKQDPDPKSGRKTEPQVESGPRFREASPPHILGEFAGSEGRGAPNFIAKSQLLLVWVTASVLLDRHHRFREWYSYFLGRWGIRLVGVMCGNLSLGQTQVGIVSVS